MADTKTAAQWEARLSIIIAQATDKELREELTLKTFLEKYPANSSRVHGVNHSDRQDFLRTNGYEVTRENMIDASLSARQPEEQG